MKIKNGDHQMSDRFNYRPSCFLSLDTGLECLNFGKEMLDVTWIYVFVSLHV